MNTMRAIDEIVQRFLEPLNDKTKALLKPLKLQLYDRLHVQLDDSKKHFIAKVCVDEEAASQFQAWQVAKSGSWPAKQFFKRIPERKQNLDGSWKLAGTDFTALVIHAAWSADRIMWDEEAKMLYDFLLLRFFSQTQAAKHYAEFKLNGVVPKLPDNFVDHHEFPLMKFQKAAVAAQLNAEGANLWMEQGTGKTPIVISRINYEAHQTYEKEGRMHRALIVVPKNMPMSWQKKIIQFAVKPGKVTILRGGKLDRLKLLIEAFKSDEDSEYTIIICSYDIVQRSWDAIRMIEWDFVALDESHMIKSPYTKRWKQIKQLRDLSKSRTGLTGTPIANNLFDAWTQLEWLGEGLSGFTSFKAFRSYYGKFVAGQGPRPFDVLVGYKNLPILQERLARLCFMVTLKEVMPELPTKTYDVLECSMTKKQAEFYVQLQKRLMIEIEAELTAKANSPNKQLTANHVLTKLLRLSQITAGYLKWDTQIDENGEVIVEGELEQILPNPKVETVIEAIKESGPQEKIIVWANWVPLIKAFQKRLTEENIVFVSYYGGTNQKARDYAESAYNEDPAIKVFLANPAAGGAGLDLWGHVPEWDGTPKDHGCNTTRMYYASQNWSMIHRSQSEGRGTRCGTRVPVQIYDVIIPGTIDEEIATRVLNKKMNAMMLQDVRDIMKRVLNYVPSGDYDD